MNQFEPHITVRAVQPMVAGLEVLGHPVDAILAEVSIDRALLSNVDGRIPHRAMMLFWQCAEARCSDVDLGLHLAEAAPIRSFEVHAYALLSSPTLRDAYLRACRYQCLIHEATDLVLEHGPDEGILRHSLPGGRPAPRQPAEALAALWVRFGRLVTGDEWMPNRVCFAHPEPANTSEHQRIFRAPLHFSSDGTALHVANAMLDCPNPRADLGLIGVLDRYAESLLASAPRSSTLSERVRGYLLEVLGSGAPTASTTAKALGMSVRSLNRTLQLEGCSYRELLEQLRRERAISLLADPRCTIGEVGFLLGFAELSSFYRAFKRWTGQTPAEYRAKNYS